eukprot:SAG31_NODE_1544_length_7943_cov_4.076237_4_plen_157_part_00
MMSHRHGNGCSLPQRNTLTTDKGGRVPADVGVFAPHCLLCVCGDAPSLSMNRTPLREADRLDGEPASLDKLDSTGRRSCCTELACCSASLHLAASISASRRTRLRSTVPSGAQTDAHPVAIFTRTSPAAVVRVCSTSTTVPLYGERKTEIENKTAK